MTGEEEIKAELELIFEGCNNSVTQLFSSLPKKTEPQLDGSMIDYLIRQPRHITTQSGWSCTFACGYTGGKGHAKEGKNWHEIGDILFALRFSQHGQFIKGKFAFCQSKVLKPHYNSLLSQYEFRDTSQYEALKIHDAQYRRIKKTYENTPLAVSVFYLLYHPYEVPYDSPARSGLGPLTSPLGIRVLPASDLRSKITAANVTTSPTYNDLDPLSSWRLEQFVGGLTECKIATLAANESTFVDQYQKLVEVLGNTWIVDIEVVLPENADFRRYED